MEFLPNFEQIPGSLNKDTSTLFGIFAEEKEKLTKWFPKAKIWIW
jgi:hypothetical protein